MPAKSLLGTLPPLGGTSRPKAFPIATVIQKTAGRPAFRRPVARPRGPEHLRLGQRRIITGGPGDPPPGFVSGTTSAVEWYWYWGSYRVLAPKLDPREPPFTGIPGVFTYQVTTEPGDPRSIGSYVSDFVYALPAGKELVVRIDTFYYHIQALPGQIARDLYQKLHGGNEDLLIISAYDEDILGDPTGRAVCAAVADALRGREPVSPVRSGRAFVVRDAISSRAQGVTP